MFQGRDFDLVWAFNLLKMFTTKPLRSLRGSDPSRFSCYYVPNIVLCWGHPTFWLMIKSHPLCLAGLNRELLFKIDIDDSKDVKSISYLYLIYILMG